MTLQFHADNEFCVRSKRGSSPIIKPWLRVSIVASTTYKSRRWGGSTYNSLISADDDRRGAIYRRWGVGQLHTLNTSAARECERERKGERKRKRVEESRRTWSDLTRPLGRRRDSAKTNQVWLGMPFRSEVFDFHSRNELEDPFSHFPVAYSSVLFALRTFARSHCFSSRARYICTGPCSHSIFSPHGQFSLNWDSTEARPWWVHLDPSGWLLSTPLIFYDRITFLVWTAIFNDKSCVDVRRHVRTKSYKKRLVHKKWILQCKLYFAATIDSNSNNALYRDVSYEGIACKITGGRDREREKLASRRFVLRGRERRRTIK